MTSPSTSPPSPTSPTTEVHHAGTAVAPSTRLDAAALRDRLNTLYLAKVPIRTIAQEVGMADNTVSAFRKGSHWGPKRLEKIALALDVLEARLAASAVPAPPAAPAAPLLDEPAADAEPWPGPVPELVSMSPSDVAGPATVPAPRPSISDGDTADGEPADLDAVLGDPNEEL